MVHIKKKNLKKNSIGQHWYIDTLPLTIFPSQLFSANCIFLEPSIQDFFENYIYFCLFGCAKS